MDSLEFYEQHCKTVTAAAKKFSKFCPNDDLQDLIQDIWVVLLSKLNTYDPKKSKPSTWIFCVARTTLINKYRDGKTQKRLVNEVAISYEDILQKISNR